MSYLEGLNDRQKEAVLTTAGPVSVLAGAGSGKTRVLATRIYHLIREGIDPERILAVTFTNKAAREMRERVARMLDPHAREGETWGRWRSGVPFIATFHGLGRELLETLGRPLGVPRHFSIFDREDSKRVIKRLLKERDIDPKELSPGAVLSRISKAKGEGQSAEEFREKEGRHGFFGRVIGDLWPAYQEELAKEKALDFDDLLVMPLRLLEAHPEAREAAQQRWDHLMIDEYQDTNVVQGRLATILAEQYRNIFVVGDIDQTIYTWRGATIDNLLAFDRTYPDAKTLVLEHNYRSSKTIVEAANQIIEKNRNRKEKVSVTENPAGEPIRVYAAHTGEHEARFIAAEAARLIKDGIAPLSPPQSGGSGEQAASQPVLAENIAVLYRTNFQSRALEEAFLSEDVPYRLIGTQFYDRKEVKDVLAWARLALDPSREADRMRAVQAPARGIGKTTLGKLAAGQRGALRAGERAKVEAFEALLRELHEAGKMLRPSEFVRLIVERSGMRAAYEKEGDDGLERLGNAEELATLASRHDEAPGEEGIAAFLADAALASDADELDRPEKEAKKGVTLMTVHAAKGLEFDAVFVSGLEEGLFPHEGSGEDDRDEEEERRLFYVAITRARKLLYLTLARVRRIYGTDYLQEPSSFLYDIDASLVEHQQPDEDDLPMKTIRI